MTTDFAIRRITLEHAKPLRNEVLRRGTPTREANYDGDLDPRTVHIGAERGERIVATSTWVIAAWQDEPTAPAVQLRGMAVLDEMQRTGVGTALIEAGLAYARECGARFVWAKARDSALGFYEGCGFVTNGDSFVEPASGLPHHLVVLELR